MFGCLPPAVEAGPASETAAPVMGKAVGRQILVTDTVRNLVTGKECRVTTTDTIEPS